MEGGIKKFWVFVTVLLIAAALVLCVYASWRGSLYIKPSGNPQLTVSDFCDALKTGKYEAAYACLSDYKTLGLEKEPASEEAKLMFEALKQSYDYELVGRCKETQMSAVQTVSFQYLNVKSVETAISRQVDSVLSQMVRERPRSEIYDENDKYLPELTDEVYLVALQQVLETPEKYYSKAEFDLDLEYVEGSWLIKTNQNLLNALVGGAA